MIVWDWGFYAGFVTSANSRPAEHKVMFSRFTTLKGLLKTKVYEKVEAINSEIPVFVSVMHKTNVAHRSSMLVSHRRFLHVKKDNENKILQQKVIPC